MEWLLLAGAAVIGYFVFTKKNDYALGLVLALAGCEATPAPREVVVICSPTEDAGAPEPFENDTTLEAKSASSPCARACKNLSTLGCPEAWKLPGGKTCVETCKSIASYSSYDPECVEKASSKTAVRKCPAIRCLE